MATSFRPPKQWVLSEHETITSFASWQSNILYHLSLNNEFAPFLEDNATWQKKSVANRGLAADGDTVAANERKTAAQKNIHLDRMLGLIAQFSPSLLRNDIIRKSLSLDWIWKRIRKHYSFQQSEVNFLRLSLIKREPEERYETLFQRIVAHLEDNLLTTDSEIHHDGAAVEANEELTPTCERLAVYLWLNLVDQRLPAHISRVYAHDLQKKSLKDLQPHICDAMDSLLAEINTQEEINVNYSRTFGGGKKYNNSNFRSDRQQQQQQQQPLRQQNSRPQHSVTQKECIICKMAGRSYLGHSVSSCWHISKADKMQMARALQVSVDFVDDTEQITEDNGTEEALQCVLASSSSSHSETSEHVRRVKTSSSPFFFAFYLHHTCRVLVDTGATSTVVSYAFVRRAGIKLFPTNHSARQLDQTSIPVIGEVRFTISFGKLELKVEGIVNNSIDCDILAGIPFCKDNDVDVLCRRELISIGNEGGTPVLIKYGSEPDSIQHDIYRVETTLLRNDAAKVIFPGEYLELGGDEIQRYEGEVSIEPRANSPVDGQWPECAITRVIQGKVRIPNHTEEPIHISKFMHVAQVRRVTTPTEPVPHQPQPAPLKPPTVCKPYSSTIKIDPSGKLLTEIQRSMFSELHQGYDNQFRPDISVYNGYSGNVKAYIDMGPIPPPQTKPKMPLYNQSNMRALQEEADSRELIGVLAKPEVVGVKVRHASPSFLVKKPDDTYRMVTAFNQLSQYVRYPPSVSITCDDVLRRLAGWKFMIKTDMKKAYYQIPMDKSSMQWLGTYTPFGGLRVYTRCVMGMPGSAEFLQELLSRVFGDLTRQGFVIIIADDMYVCGNTIDDLFTRWKVVLHHCQLNNLTLSPSKTVICPESTIVLGWVWCSGTIAVSAHKISPLVKIDTPITCSAMRSFIGAYKAISRCIPRYSSLMSPMENCIKGLQGSQKIVWTDELREHFKRAQEALNSSNTLTIPTASDKLILTVDASPVNDGIGSTLFVVRNGKRHLGEFFSLKLKTHQSGWQPCELEALAITTGVQHFAPYIRESNHPLQVLTDSKPCVQAFARLCKGKFSASSRVSTFLSCLSEHRVTVQHLKGEGNRSSDFASRNPTTCCDNSCQICEFANDMSNSVVNAVTVTEVLDGSARIPFYNKSAWRSAQQNCQALRKTHTYLINGTRPSKKAKNILSVRRYLEVCSLDSASGLIIVRKSDPYMLQRDLIVVPADILRGFLTALHLYFNHATVLQLKKVFNRYFFALNLDASVTDVVDSCSQCTALKSLPKETFTQSTSPTPQAPGQLFAADVIKRSKQLIFAIRDVHSSFSVAEIIPDETAKALQSALITTTTNLRCPQCSIRVDSAPGFKSLKNDEQLKSLDISLDFGRTKNINKNPVGEKANSELEAELLKLDPTGAPVSNLTLQKAVHMLNSRIRNRGLSSREILFCRDQITSKHLDISDSELSKLQHELRLQNHIPSALSKSNNAKPAVSAPVQVGSLVYLKKEGNKFRGRNSYIVTHIKDHLATLQKLNGSGKFMMTTYEVPLEELLLAVKHQASNEPAVDSSSSEEDEPAVVTDTGAVAAPAGSQNSDVVLNPPLYVPPPLRRSVRERQEPSWLRDNVWDRS